jgi:TRIAD3 protein (E3 ubiquitin-protein ligase RNF216)
MTGHHIEDAFDVVNLASDNEEGGFSGNDLEFFDAQDQLELPGPGFSEDEFPDMNMDGILDVPNARYQPVYDAVDGIIDLTGIPDIDVPPSDPIPVDSSSESAESNDLDRDDHLVSEAMALQMVLDFLPDISVDHVLNIFREKTTDFTRTNATCQKIISQLVEDGAYPKEDDEANSKKRKRNDEDDWKDYDKEEPDPGIPTYELDA